MSPQHYISLEDDLKERLKDPGFRREWEKPDPQIEILKAVITLYKEFGHSKKELAARLGVTQAEMDRLEECADNLKITTLANLARAIDKTLKIEFV